MNIRAYRVPVGLAAIICALLILNVQVLRVANDRLQTIASTRPALSKAPDPTPLTQAISHQTDPAAIQEHAIFHASRAFYRPPPPSPELPIPDYRVVGAMVLPAGKRVAYIQRGGEATSHAIHVGDSVEAWTVSAISPSGVALVHGNQTAELPAKALAKSQGLVHGNIANPVAMTGIRVLGSAGLPKLAKSGSGPAEEAPHTFRLPPQ